MIDDDVLALGGRNGPKIGQKQASDISLTMSVWIFGRFPHSTFKLCVHAKSQASRSINGRAVLARDMLVIPLGKTSLWIKSH